MNRSNIWVHLSIAIVIIGIAGIAGQIRRWQSDLTAYNSAPDRSAIKAVPKTVAIPRQVADREPEVLVKFKPNVSLDEIRKIAAKNNDQVEDEIESVKGLVSIDDLDNAEPTAIASQYSALADQVDYAEPNFEIRLDPAEGNGAKDLLQREPVIKGPNDPMFAEQWALSNQGQNGGKANADVSAIKAWLKTQGSDDVVVAVLDSGVDYTHSDLVENIWHRPDSVPAYKDDELGMVNDSTGFNAANNQVDPMDDNGHGTHCAGIIGAEGDNNEGIAGINWHVRIMPLKFLSRGGMGTTKDAIEAINYAVDRKQHGVNLKVINASWGSTSKSKALESAIRAAGEAGILFVAAAGNDSSDNDGRPYYPSNYDLPNVLSIAALDRNDDLASFSNYGANKVHIAAPGKDILSTWLNNDFREASGTSMATPYVAGVAALVLANEPKLGVEKLRDRLIKSVDKLDVLDGKVKSGGRINAAKALGS